MMYDDIEWKLYIVLKLFVTSILLIGCTENNKKGNERKVLFNKVNVRKSNITFNNSIEENYKNFFLNFNYIYDGAGVSVGDINNDGLSDIYFVGNQVPNRLYINKGDFEFKDITKSAGVSGSREGGWHNGSVMVDINNDGYLDIYVTRGGWKQSKQKRKNLLFINQKDLTFIEKSDEYGLGDNGYSLQASFFDMDSDGDLDIYITNRPESFFLNASEVKRKKGSSADYERDKLYENKNGKFKGVGIKKGIRNNFGYGLGLVTSDINKDGHEDVFVANDFIENDYLYINKGEGEFREKVRKYMKHNSFYSMGADIADINNDGMEDIVVTEMMPDNYIRSKTSSARITMNEKEYRNILNKGFHKQYMHNMLYLNRGKEYFSEISQLSGIHKTGWSWAVLASDFDNDSYRDLFITNGLKRDINNLDSERKAVNLIEQHPRNFSSRKELLQKLAGDIINTYPKNSLSNYVFKNKGDLTFSDSSDSWGFGEETISHGAAVGDLDNDGDLDIVVNNQDNRSFIYENRSVELLSNNYLRIKVRGPRENINGLGSKVIIKYNGEKQFFEVKNTRGYLSSSESIAHFGLGTTQSVDTVKVKWYDSSETTKYNVEANQILKINYEDSVLPVESASNKNRKGILSKVTNRLFDDPYVHQENEHDDYEVQSLLPYSLSRSGPSISVGDVNNDNLDDFYIGGATGHSGQLFLQRRDSTFTRKRVPVFSTDKSYEDVSSAFFDADGDGNLDLYVVSGGSEFPKGSSMYHDRLYINQGNGDFLRSKHLPNTTTSGCCVEPSDYDNDGDMDLFVGGHHVPQSYPSPPRSYLFENNDGNFINVTSTLCPKLDSIGMVRSATWSDVDADSSKELIIVGEWMSIQVLSKSADGFSEISSSLGVDDTVGLWNVVVSTDFDNDSDKDLLVGNIGLNNRFAANYDESFHIFADDLDSDKIPEIILSTSHSGNLVPIQSMPRLDREIPGVTSQFSSHKSFAKSDLKHIFDNLSINNALHYRIDTFASTLFINNDDTLSSQELPVMSQFSSINDFELIDYNNDKLKDILLGGNNLADEFDKIRNDASTGLLLKNYEGNLFKPVKDPRSSFFIPYNVRSIDKISLGNDSNKHSILVGSNQDTLQAYYLNY